jgi:hypothetical protein
MTLAKPFTLLIFIVFLVLGAFLFGGAAITACAANSFC